MSTLSQRLKRPEPYLAAIFILIALVSLDSFREPESQVAVPIYVAAVRAFQMLGRPVLEGRIQFRYQPTCSEFSLQAVREYGIRRGLEMTYARLRSCTRQVPLGTYSPLR